MRSKGFFYNLAGFVFENVCDSRRILATFAKFCLNSLYATWSYRFTRHAARARAQAPLHLPHKFFDVKSFYKILPLLPIVTAKSRLNASGISSPHAVFVQRLGNLVSAKKSKQGEEFVKFCVKKACVGDGAWVRAGWRVWDLGNSTIMLQKLFNPEWYITSKSFLLASFLSGFSFSPTTEISSL